MGIDKRVSRDGGISWRVRVRVKGFPTATATFKRRTDAREWQEATRTKIREQLHFPHREAQRRTVADLIERYRTEILPHKARNRDRPQRELSLDWWRDQLGAYRLSALDSSLVAETRNKISTADRGPATVNRYLAALSHACAHAIRWGWLRSNPCTGLRLAEPEGRRRFLSDDERARLLDACRKSEQRALHAVVVLALSTGMRRGEIMRLAWDAVDLKSGTIRLERTKNGDRRLVPLVGYALEAVGELAKVRRIDSRLLFPGRDPTKPVDLDDAWRTALKRAVVEDFRFHDLRHSCASYLAMNGATPSELAAVLGHRTLSMVRRYAHIADAHVAKVVERMNLQIFGGIDGRQ